MKILLLALCLSAAGCHKPEQRFDLPHEVFVHVDPRDCKLTDPVHKVWHCKNADLMPQKVNAK